MQPHGKIDSGLERLILIIISTLHFPGAGVRRVGRSQECRIDILQGGRDRNYDLATQKLRYLESCWRKDQLQTLRFLSGQILYPSSNFNGLVTSAEIWTFSDSHFRITNILALSASGKTLLVCARGKKRNNLKPWLKSQHKQESCNYLKKKSDEYTIFKPTLISTTTSP